jgi:hypothetical protein
MARIHSPSPPRVTPRKNSSDRRACGLPAAISETSGPSRSCALLARLCPGARIVFRPPGLVHHGQLLRRDAAQQHLAITAAGTRPEARAFRRAHLRLALPAADPRPAPRTAPARGTRSPRPAAPACASRRANRPAIFRAAPAPVIRNALSACASNSLFVDVDPRLVHVRPARRRAERRAVAALVAVVRQHRRLRGLHHRELLRLVGDARPPRTVHVASSAANGWLCVGQERLVRAHARAERAEPVAAHAARRLGLRSLGRQRLDDFVEARCAAPAAARESPRAECGWPAGAAPLRQVQPARAAHRLRPPAPRSPPAAGSPPRSSCRRLPPSPAKAARRSPRRRPRRRPSPSCIAVRRPRRSPCGSSRCRCPSGNP